MGRDMGLSTTIFLLTLCWNGEANKRGEEDKAMMFHIAVSEMECRCAEDEAARFVNIAMQILAVWLAA